MKKNPLPQNSKPEHTDGIFPSDKSKKNGVTSDDALRMDTATHRKQSLICVSNKNRK